MNKTTILSIISEGETRSVDFKRELNLNSSREKAELVKDIISLANSSFDKGYLLIGIDDKNLLHGINNLEEERIQQIAHVY